MLFSAHIVFTQLLNFLNFFPGRQKRDQRTLYGYISTKQILILFKYRNLENVMRFSGKFLSQKLPHRARKMSLEAKNWSVHATFRHITDETNGIFFFDFLEIFKPKIDFSCDA